MTVLKHISITKAVGLLYLLLFSHSAYIHSAQAIDCLNLIEAAKIGNLSALNQILAQTPEKDIDNCINIQDQKRNTALHYGAAEGYTDIVEALLAKLKDKDAAINKKNNDGDTVLMVAVKNRHAAGVKELLANIEDVNAAINIQNNDGHTALMVATESGDTAVLKEIVTAYIHSQAIDRSNLIETAENGNLSALKQILAQIPEQDIETCINKQNQLGNTALIVAARNGHAAIVKELLTKLKEVDANIDAAINIQNHFGKSALLIAARNGDAAVVKELLANARDVDAAVKIQNRGGSTALLAAILSANKDTIEYLVTRIQNKQLNIPRKCAFLTFEQDDHNYAMTNHLYYMLLQNVIAINSAHILKQLITKFPFITQHFSSWSLFVNGQDPRDQDIKPDNISLGVIIPEINSDPERLIKKYGLQNLKYVKPELVDNTLKNLTKKVGLKEIDKFDQVIDQFNEIIDRNSPNHPVSFYLVGHGLTDITIAGMPLPIIMKFFTTLNNMQTQFLYINSCYAAGHNLNFMQKKLQEILEKKRKSQFLQLQPHYKKFFQTEAETTTQSVPTSKETFAPTKKPINYAIAIQATSDIPTYGEGNIYAFFTQLNKFLERPTWFFGQRLFAAKELPESIPSITDVIDALGVKYTEALPSIRFPGTTTFFRAIDLKEMEIITWPRLNALRLERRLSPAFGNIKETLRPAVKVYQARLDDISKKLDYIIKKEQLMWPEIDPQVQANLSQEKENLTREKDFLTKRIQEIEENLEAQLAQLAQVTFTIATPDIKYIQAFPLDLHECTFEIIGKEIPKFYSKIPGQGQHFIGNIKFISKKTTIAEALQDFVKNAFVDIFSVPVPASSNKAWFINSLQLTVNNTLTNIRKLAIYQYPGVNKPYHAEFTYIDPDGTYKKVVYESDGLKSSTIDQKQQFIDKIIKYAQDTTPACTALFEATGGNELCYTLAEKARLEQARKEERKTGGVQLEPTVKSAADSALEWFLADI